MMTTTTEQSGARYVEHDQHSPSTADRAWPPAPEQRQWRFVSAVHAARALNARPA
jgi:hypothetical protein